MNSQDIKMELYGTGLAYPIQLDPTGSKPLLASGEDLIFMSMEQIIYTDIEERPFLVKNGVPFGTRMRRSLFEPAEIVIDVFLYDVPRALATWEPRIVVTGVDAKVSATDKRIVVGSIMFVYRATSRPDSFVTPFQLQNPDAQR